MTVIKQIYSTITFFIVILLFTSCEKPEGLGGNGEIKGMVTVNLYDTDFKVLQATYPAVKKDVFIIYGDDNTISNSNETSNTGDFSFSYLRKGDYTIFVYSDGKLESSPSGKVTVEKDVTLNSNKDVVDVGELIIYETIDVNDGDATIKGRVRQVNYTSDFNFIRDTTNAQEAPVYIFYEDNPEYIERLRTLDDGTFALSHLIKGKYTIKVYSEDITGGKEDVMITAKAEISNFGQTVDVGDIFIAKN